jgi:hypothetical protein
LTPVSLVTGMLVNLLIALFLIAILGSLFAGGYFVVRDPSSKRRAFWALSWRVGLQLALLLFLILAFLMGWIKPHELGG